MENLRHPDGSEWRQLLNEALVEVAPDKLKAKIIDAETAIERRQALGQADAEEQLALQDASSLLLTLKKTNSEFPSSGAEGNELQKAG